MSFNLTRMTAYAIISSLEEDLRIIVKNFIFCQPEQSINIDKALIERARSRLEKDLGGLIDNISLVDLVDYFDLGDTYQTINSNSSAIPNHISRQIKSKTKKMERMVSVRNRVMHIRPLDADDYPFTFSFCSELVNEDESTWTHTDEILKKINRDPSCVFSIDIKTFDEAYINHNLPMPDFDETGLIGRSDDLDKIKKLCLGSFPVISIVGEGGIGKTALALKVAYELLEQPDNPFDAIVWVSSKTTQITVNEIQEIKGAINDSIGVIREISQQISGVMPQDSNFESYAKEIIEYMGTFKIALFIDNLETILDDKIRNFISEIPQGSKIIITSRIGLGAYEYPIKLQGMEENYASQLLRKLSQIRNVEPLYKMEESVLRKYVNRMGCNPSYIKWFVSSVQTGLSPESILQNSDMFLDFCMSNVYNYLPDDAKILTAAMQCAPGLRDIPELSYLTNFDSIRLQKSLQALMTTNMMSQSSKTKGYSVKTTYQLSELSRDYLGKHHKPSQTYQRDIRSRLNQLNSIFESQMTNRNRNKYNTNNIKMRDKSDRVIAKMLSDAQKFISNAEHSRAYDILSEAKRLAPDYFETARVMAYFHQQSGNLNDSRKEYDLAIALAPDLSQLHYWYGKYLLRHEENIDDATAQFNIAHDLDPDAVEVALFLARCYMFQHDFEQSLSILDKIGGNVDDFEFGHQKIYFDARIQINYRKADDFIQNGQTESAIDSLEMMISEFNHTPTAHKDTYLRKKLNKCMHTVSKAMKSCTNTDKPRCQKIMDWLEIEQIPVYAITE
ncbi:tetratricopeptide repeat protein [Aeromonas veronii]|uniref:tetratricopeptide repeat protein n=1 Tax=Aeromonas veronii TaxID=654 RepID=UPI003BA337A5